MTYADSAVGIPTEPIGSIPRPLDLLQKLAKTDSEDPALVALYQRVFVGVIASIHPRIETAEEVRDRVLEGSEYVPVGQLGTTDDCGFAPFSDDTSTTRDTALAKIRAPVVGTSPAEKFLRGHS